MFNLSNFTVQISTATIEGLISSQILSDYGCKVLISSKKEEGVTIDLQISDQSIFNSNLQTKHPVLVLSKTNVSSIHILAQSGLLSVIGQTQSEVFDPQFIVQYIVANSLVIFILQNLLFKQKVRSQPIFISVIDLVSYYGAFFISAKQNSFINNPKGKNILDGGAPFYSIYQCKQGLLAVGNLQPKFYSQMIKGLNLTNEQQVFLVNNQLNMNQWGKIRQILSNKFKQQTAAEWQINMNQFDTCITQVKDSQNYARAQPRINWLNKSKL